VYRSPPTPTRRSYGAGDLFQRFGSAPWHVESMNKYLSRCHTAALGALMPCAWSAVAPQVHLFGRWRKQKPGASRRCSGDFKICWSSQRMETVLPRSVTTRGAESAMDCSCSIRAQNAPRFGVFRSPPTPTRRSYGVGDLFQRFGSAPWHVESMNKCLVRWLLGDCVQLVHSEATFGLG
jgi:hypothetical protein